MPQKIKVTVDGVEQEQEVYTADELTARAEERAKELAEDRVSEVSGQFEAEKVAAEERAKAAEESASQKEVELEKLRKKDFNFEQLRKSKTLTPEQEKAAQDNTDQLKKLQDTVAEIQRQPLEVARTSFLDSNFAPEDKEQRDLFDYYYKKLSVGAKSMDDVNKSLVAAFNATTGGQRQPSRAGQFTHTSINDNYNGDLNNRGESEASREFGSMMGLSADDKKRFGNVAKSGSVSLFSKNPSKQ